MDIEFSRKAAGGLRAVLVHINFRASRLNEELEEFDQLARSSGLSIVATVTGRRDIPDARFFVGTGKVTEIGNAVIEHGADIVVFNHELSPGQERNVEKECRCRVVDRVGLILDIFAQRARTYEGKLQVELAQLQRLSTRLVRGWSHLERQKGGIGLRGPGETQLETDRRLIGKRIRTINSRLAKVRRQRGQVRRLRQRTSTPVISLVGYTNAGKSTLFNQLTGASVYAADKLFATLDPTLRQILVPPERKAILSDTVGFIRHIPHDLIESFQATLEEITEADLLLHVVDANSDHREAQMRQVDQVIEEIGAATVPQILVYNKIDVNGNMEPRLEMHNGAAPSVWLSARTGAGLELLKDLISRVLKPRPIARQLHLPASAGSLRARLFEQGAVCAEQEDQQGGWVMQVEIDAQALERIVSDQGFNIDSLHQGPRLVRG